MGERVKERARHSCLLLAAWLCLPAMWAGNPPNVVVVTIDTLRADRLGCYGYGKAETPALDALAREGVRFERAISPVPLTLPAHVSIFTGTYPPWHGVRDNSGFRLTPQHITLATHLKRRNYATAAFVGSYVLDSRFGLNQGFDYYYDRFDLDRYQSVSPGYIRRGGDQVVAEAVRWLKGAGKGPFFIWVHLYDPHDPYRPPEPYASRHRASPYDGAIAFADANLGRLIEFLKNNGLYANSLVVVLGDHGEALGEHGEQTHGFFIYAGILHVPLIVRLPGGLHAAKTIAQPVSTVDVLPTIAQYLGTGGPELAAVQGRSLMGAIEGRTLPDAPIYAESWYPRLQFGWSELTALMRGSRKYILAPRPELYDLARDLPEAHNLAGVDQEAATGMRRDLAAFAGKITAPDASGHARTAVDARTIAKLQSLGYVGHSMGDTGRRAQALADPKEKIGVYRIILGLAERNSRGDYASTIPRYLEILQGQPDLTLVHYKLGQAYFQTGSFPQALEQFKAALASGGDSVGPSFELAMTYAKLGRPDDAMLAFRHTIDLDPAHYQARTNLGVLLTGQNRIPEAVSELEKAVALAPQSASALSSLGIAYSMAGQHDKGVEALQRALRIAPGDAFLHANLGVIYDRQGRKAEAEEQYGIARRLKPGFFKN